MCVDTLCLSKDPTRDPGNTKFNNSEWIRCRELVRRGTKEQRSQRGDWKVIWRWAQPPGCSSHGAGGFRQAQTEGSPEAGTLEPAARGRHSRQRRCPKTGTFSLLPLYHPVISKPCCHWLNTEASWALGTAGLTSPWYQAHGDTNSDRAQTGPGVGSTRGSPDTCACPYLPLGGGNSTLFFQRQLHTLSYSIFQFFNSLQILGQTFRIKNY